MNKKTVINKTKKFVKEIFNNDTTGHDWWHAYRVWKLAIKIGSYEGGDLFIIEMAALLHDVEDFKFSRKVAKPALNWLKNLNIPDDQAQQIYSIIKNVSFKGSGEKNKIKTLEGMIVQDADRLDALGAMGIARTFAYNSHINRPIHDPLIKPKLHKNFKEYKNSKGTAINHFYEKLLLLKDMMNTKTGKRLAGHRHNFLEAYLKEFHQEWVGKK